MCTRFARISAASPIHNSKCSSASSRSTSVRVHWLPCSPALWLLLLPDRGRIFRFRLVPQAPLLYFPVFAVHIRNLLEARVITPTIIIVGCFSRALVGWHHQVYSGCGSRHCQQSTTGVLSAVVRILPLSTGGVALHRKTVVPLTTRRISDQKLRTYKEFKCNLKLR